MSYFPPPEYVHPYPGPLTVWIMPAPKVDAFCRLAGGKERGQYRACEFKIGKHCFIVLSQHAVELDRPHEIAHCNGWVHP